DLAHARGRELFLDGGHLRADDLVANRRVGEDSLELDDVRADVDDLALEVDATEPGQLRQAHLEDVLRLQLTELERHGHESGLGFSRVLAAPNEGDDLIDDIEGLDATLEEV